MLIQSTQSWLYNALWVKVQWGQNRERRGTNISAHEKLSAAGRMEPGLHARGTRPRNWPVPKGFIDFHI